MQNYSLHYYWKIDSFMPKTYFVKHLPVDASDFVLSSFANQMHNDISLEECFLKDANPNEPWSSIFKNVPLVFW